MNSLEREVKEGDNPVVEMVFTFWIIFLSTTGHVEPCGKLGGPSSKAKYFQQPIVN